MSIRRLFQLIPMLVLFLGLGTGPAEADGNLGVVDGRLVNGTAGGSSVVDQEVMLQVYDEHQQVDERKAETDAQGAFRFEGLATGPGLYYRALVTYQEVSYQSQVGQILDPEEPLSLEVTVYDATEDGNAVSVEQSHLLVAFSPGAVIVNEMMVFNNAGDRSYVGSEPASGGMGGKAALHFPLPAGAREVKPQEGLMSCCVVDSDDGFVYTMPVLPGSQPVAFSYRVPFDGSSFELTRSLPYTVAQFNVLMTESSVAVTSDDLKDAGLVAGKDGNSYRRLTASDLPARAEVAIHFEGIPVPQKPAPAPQPATALVPFSPYALVAGGGLLLLVSVGLLWRRRDRKEDATDTVLEPDDETAAEEA